MRVTLVVDALLPQLSGIGRYTLELLQGLPEVEGISRVHRFAHGRVIKDIAPLLRGDPVRRPTKLGRWWSRREWERIARSTIVHAPNYFLPPGVERGIMTIHDLSVFRFPETHPPERIRHFEQHFQDSLSRAGHFITDTETIRQEVIAMFGVAPDMITAVPLGVSNRFRPRTATELAGPLASLGLLPGGYALCVSTFEPRKRIAELIDVWGDLPASIRLNVPLVLAGGRGWLNDGLMAKVEAGVAAGWLRHLAYVAEESMPALYAGSKLFIYPSIYEGFGLPPLEAMASGVPVIVARRACAIEVCGDAAHYVEPDDHQDFRRAVLDLLSCCTAEGGIARAAEYDWSTCINRTAQVYGIL